MNILFVNYGNFTTNSLNHIGGFAGWLCAKGHDCIVAVPEDKESLSAVLNPRFTAATFAELLARPASFANGKPADLIHAWTPREGVRKFVEAHQRQHAARVVVHLEDNEDYLLEAFGRRPVGELRELPEQKFPFPMVDGLPHPVRYHHLLRLAEAATVINGRLREFVPPGVPTHLLLPGVDADLYRPQAPDPQLRAEVGIGAGEKVLVFTGSVTFANAPEIRQLYDAVHKLNQRGIRTRLIRTGFTLPEFIRDLGYDCSGWVSDLGFVPKDRLPKLLALADALVQPGEAGPFNDYRLPSKIPEYLTIGKPVILPASNVGLMLADGQEALVLQRGTADEIAASCERIFRDPALGERLGRGAAAFARRHFDLDRNAAGLLAHYEKVLAGPANPAWAALAGTVETDLPAVISRVRSRLEAIPVAEEPVKAEMLAALADFARAARQLDANLQERSGTLADWKRHALGLEQTRDILTRDLDVLRTRSTEHARELEAEIRRLDLAAHKALERARGYLPLFEHELNRLKGDLQESEHRVLRMQASLSWRGTAWLRALRRKLIDPYFGAPVPPPVPPQRKNTVPVRESDFWLHAPAPKMDSHIDAPRQWPAETKEMTVRGWVVADAGGLQGVRARVNGRLYTGEYGLSRPDVGLNYPGNPTASRCGFRLIMALERTDDLLVLEVQDPEGLWHVFHRRTLDHRPASEVPGTYAHWVNEFDTFTPAELDALRAKGAALTKGPLISILMPVYNTPVHWLTRAIDSVRAQAYPRWQLCVADDASPQSHIRPLLERYVQIDPRIKVVFRPKNGHISEASNSALGVATGTHTALMDHDDELPPHALLCMAEAILARPAAEVLYSDEDKIDGTGNRFDPHFKPDWNPDLLDGQNYLSHLTVYRTATLRAAGGFRAGFEGAQDWDLALRVTERLDPGRIVHVPRILYHWRAVEGSTAMQQQEKEYTSRAGRRALEEHFARLGTPVDIRQVAGGHWHARRPLPEPAPLVTLVIPTRNRRELLECCIESIFTGTAYPNFEILVADNDSDDPALFAYYERRKQLGRFAVLPCPGAFNYSAINNRAVREARGTLVGLLNNDLETMHPEWLSEMVGQALRPEIGCVGAKLYYPDMHIQHAGVITGLGGVAGHAFKGCTREEPGTPQFRPHLVQNLSAVTAACLVIRKEVYLRAGGLNETNLAVAFNDVDFCLKVQALGLRNLFTPLAELVHHESASRGAEDTSEKIERFQSEILFMKEHWGEHLLEDPAYNPNLSLDHEDWSLAYPPRVPRLLK